MKQLRIFIVAFALLMLFAVMPAPTHAAGLTAPQIEAILNLLAAFNADQSVINNVSASLRGVPIGTSSTTHQTTPTAQASSTAQVSVSTPALPSFTAVPTSGTAPFTTTYTLRNLPLQGDETIDFGDGIHIPLGTASPAVAVHQYTAPGTYTARLVRGGSVFGYTSVTVYAAPVTTPTNPICSLPPAIDCIQGYHPESQGFDANSCKKADKCVANIMTCSPVPAVDCIQGYVPVSGGVSSTGCILPNKCVASTAPRISTTVIPSAATTGQHLTIAWSAQNVPAGSYVYLQLVPVAGGASGGIIADLKATSGSFVWTVPASNSTSYAGDYRIRGSNITSGASYKVRAFVYKPTTQTCMEGCSPTMGTAYTYGDSTNVTVTTSAASGNGSMPAQGASGYLETTKISENTNTGVSFTLWFSLMGSGLAAVADAYLSIFGMSLE